MTLATAFHFIRPAALLMIPLALAAWWGIVRMQDGLRGWRQSVDPTLLQAMLIGRMTTIQTRHWLLLAAWITGAIAVAGPTWQPEPSPFSDDPVPLMVVLKAGESMNTEDLLPNRMQRAQLEIADLANARTGQPLGLIAWAGTAHLVLPPTRDTSVVATMAAEISSAIMPVAGSDLRAALDLAARTMGDNPGPILVVADMIDDVESLAEFRRQNSSPVILFAVCQQEVSELPQFRQAASQLNASVIQIAADDSDTQTIVQEAASAPVAIAAADESTRWQEAGWWLCPLLAAICLAGFRRVAHSAQETVK